MNRYQDIVAELGEEPYGGRKIGTTEAEIQEFEQLIGNPLPPDYREFVCDFGGITFQDSETYSAAFCTSNVGYGGWAGVHCFYNIDVEKVRLYWEESRSYHPPELIPVADNGNVSFYLAVSGPHIGSFYQFYPSYFPEKLFYYPELTLIDRSFDRFLRRLRAMDNGYDELQADIAQVKEELKQLKVRDGNPYSNLMARLKGRFVYSPIGEDSKHLSDAELAELETKIGAELPEDYREFLRDFGGYGFLGTTFYFHGLIGCDYHDILEHHNRLKSVLPQGLLPIADAGTICLSLTGSGAGRIFRVEERVREFSLCLSWGGNKDPLKVVPIAQSFDEFVHSAQLLRSKHTRRLLDDVAF